MFGGGGEGGRGDLSSRKNRDLKGRRGVWAGWGGSYVGGEGLGSGGELR